MTSKSFVKACLPLLVAVARPSRADVTLIADGQAQAALVALNEAALEPAQELAAYLQKMSEATLPVINSAAGEAVPRNGAARVTVALAADLPADAPATWRDLAGQIKADGYALAAADRQVAILATHPTALWFGVFALLERLGCGFYGPGEIGENVPERKPITLPDLALVDNPKMIYRSMWWGYSGRPAWMQKRFTDWQRRSRGGGVAASMGHNLYRIYPPEQYGRERPEFYPLINGQRAVPQGGGEGWDWQPCTSNPQVIQVAIDAAVAAFDHQPDLYSFSLSPNDGYGWCECENCVALDPPEYRGQTRRGMGRRFALFANAVAAGLAEKHPDKYVAFYAYAGTVEPPTDVKLHPNVLVAVAPYGHVGCNIHPVGDPRCPMKTGFKDILDGWAKVSRHLMIREYFDVLTPATDGLAHVVGAYTLAEDIPYYYRHGAIGISSESEADYGICALNHYLAGKLMWDPEADADALIDGFFAGMYGPAAANMQEYAETIRDLCRQRGDRGDFFTEEEMEQLGRLLKAAAALAETDLQRRRVQLSQDYFDYVQLMRAYTRRPRREQRERIAALVERLKAGQSLAVDTVVHDHAFQGSAPPPAKVLPEYATLRPVSREPMPEEAASVALRVRGMDTYVVRVQQGETLAGRVVVYKLGNYLSPALYTVTSPSGKLLHDGSAGVDEADEFALEAPETGTYVISVNAGSNCAYITLRNPYFCLAGPRHGFVGSSPRTYFWVPASARTGTLLLESDAPGETARLIVYDPDGKVVAGGETVGTGRFSVELPLTDANRGWPWSIEITRASEGYFEDNRITLGGDLPGYLATHPTRLLTPGD
jgi:hypothetical protein